MSDRAKEILKPFEAERAYMEDRIASGIEANRKGLVQLRFVDGNNAPVTGVHVELKQTASDFRFGANLFMLGQMESQEKNQEYERLFRELFNLATVPFYWCDLEPIKGKPRFAKDSPFVYRRPAPDACVEWCEQQGIEPKLHCLNYDQWTPMWLGRDVPSVKRYLDKRIGEIADRYRSCIPSMEVINETLCEEQSAHVERTQNRHSTRFFREPDLVEWSFANARRHLPYTKLIINEATQFIWGPGFHYNRGPYYTQIERALGKGATIDSIGMQFHMFYRAEEERAETAKMYDPRILYAVMDQFADFGLPEQLTEITIPAYSLAAEDEDIQAEILKNLYSIWFSHANMEALIYWNLVDGYAAFAPQGDMTYGENYYHGALVHFDMSKKPAYNVLQKLIHETWRTRLSLDSGASDSITAKGFYGGYEGTAMVGGKTVPVAFHLEKGANNTFTVRV
mgnify:CR=1 FL=1